MFNKKESKEKLKAYVLKRIDTTMIGALHDIEKYAQDMDPAVYSKIRSDILDRGNREKRLLECELDNYDVTYLYYKYELPIKRI